MKRWFKTCVLVLPVLLLTASIAGAEVKTREKGQVKFEGMLGRIMGMFGGKAAKEGIITTEAVKGDRKAEIIGDNGRIVDLKEEKVYTVDYKKKTYTVKTFEQIRREMQEAQEKAEKQAEREEPRDEKEKDQGPRKEYEVDFDLKETGQKRQIAGYDTREVVMTVAVREKGKTIEESGGMVMTTNSWLGPEIKEMKELFDFEMRYAKAIAPETAGISPEQMAAVMAMFPLFKQAADRMAKENVDMKGTPLASTMVLETVKSKEQIEAAQKQSSSGGGGIGGLLARKIGPKPDTKPRSVVFTVNTETLEVATSVAGTELAVPADFKEKK
jgi:hypothetical protein